MNGMRTVVHACMVDPGWDEAAAEHGVLPGLHHPSGQRYHLETLLQGANAVLSIRAARDMSIALCRAGQGPDSDAAEDGRQGQ